MITQQKLKELLHYSPETGIFTWKVRPANRVKVGQEAGSYSGGYRRIRIDDKRYYGHRLAWLYMYGEFPDRQIDHINEVKDDNRIVNLREASYQLQQQNISSRKNNTSGIKGVYWHKVRQKWMACIVHNYKQIHLGYFDTKFAAQMARHCAELELEWNI